MRLLSSQKAFILLTHITAHHGTYPVLGWSPAPHGRLLLLLLLSLLLLLLFILVLRLHLLCHSEMLGGLCPLHCRLDDGAVGGLRVIDGVLGGVDTQRLLLCGQDPRSIARDRQRDREMCVCVRERDRERAFVVDLAATHRHITLGLLGLRLRLGSRLSSGYVLPIGISFCVC